MIGRKLLSIDKPITTKNKKTLELAEFSNIERLKQLATKNYKVKSDESTWKLGNLD